MTPRILTEAEVKKYGLLQNEKFALVDKSKGNVFLGSDTELFCRQTLEKMTTSHPKYKDMELVTQPDR